MLKHIPNALTLTRLILAPVIAWFYWLGASPWPPHVPGLGYDEAIAQYDYLTTTYLSLAAVLFVVAALTDLFDGMAARAFNAHSKFGRIIDPIADKALVSLPLIAIVLSLWHARFLNFFYFPITLAVAVIVVRDVTMTWVRLAAPDGEGARVSSLAKIKTALELFVVGSFLVVAAIETHFLEAVAKMSSSVELQQALRIDLPRALWIGWSLLLVITAALSAYTGWQYLRPTKKS